MGADHRAEPLLFRGQRFANQLLQHGIAGGHEALRGQGMPEFSEDIHGFGAHAGGLLGFGRQLLPCGGITVAIVAEGQNDALLLEPGDLGNLHGWKRAGK